MEWFTLFTWYLPMALKCTCCSIVAMLIATAIRYWRRALADDAKPPKDPPADPAD